MTHICLTQQYLSCIGITYFFFTISSRLLVCHTGAPFCFFHCLFVCFCSRLLVCLFVFFFGLAGCSFSSLYLTYIFLDWFVALVEFSLLLNLLYILYSIVYSILVQIYQETFQYMNGDMMMMMMMRRRRRIMMMMTEPVKT